MPNGHDDPRKFRQQVLALFQDPALDSLLGEVNPRDQRFLNIFNQAPIRETRKRFIEDQRQFYNALKQQGLVDFEFEDLDVERVADEAAFRQAAKQFLTETGTLPSAQRAAIGQRVRERLQSEDLSPEERTALQAQQRRLSQQTQQQTGRLTAEEAKAVPRHPSAVIGRGVQSGVANLGELALAPASFASRQFGSGDLASRFSEGLNVLRPRELQSRSPGAVETATGIATELAGFGATPAGAGFRGGARLGGGLARRAPGIQRLLASPSLAARAAGGGLAGGIGSAVGVGTSLLGVPQEAQALLQGESEITPHLLAALGFGAAAVPGAAIAGARFGPGAPRAVSGPPRSTLVNRPGLESPAFLRRGQPTPRVTPQQVARAAEVTDFPASGLLQRVFEQQGQVTGAQALASDPALSIGPQQRPGGLPATGVRGVSQAVPLLQRLARARGQPAFQPEFGDVTAPSALDVSAAQQAQRPTPQGRIPFVASTPRRVPDLVRDAIREAQALTRRIEAAENVARESGVQFGLEEIGSAVRNVEQQIRSSFEGRTRRLTTQDAEGLIETLNQARDALDAVVRGAGGGPAQGPGFRAGRF